MAERATLDIPAEPATLSGVRRFVADTHASWAPVTGTVERAILAVDELVTNAIEHAKSPAVIILERREADLVIGVGDKSTESPVLREARVEDSNGRGLQIVRAVSSDWGSEPEHPTGKIVWAILRDALRAPFQPGRTSPAPYGVD